MGKIVISSNATLDGVVQDPDGSEGFARGGWFHQSAGAKDLADWAARETEELQGAEALLLGGRTGAWFESRTPAPGSTDVRVSPEFADRMHHIPKYIVSSSPEAARWNNATILDGDVAQEISNLKEKLDGEILVYGSFRLVRTMIAHGLADELRLVVFPVVLGTGHRLFDEITDRTPLRLVDTRKLGDSLVFCSYELR